MTTPIPIGPKPKDEPPRFDMLVSIRFGNCATVVGRDEAGRSVLLVDISSYPDFARAQE